MDFELPDVDDPRRVAVRTWLETHPDPSPADVARAGFVQPAWPPPWGLGADPIHQLVIAEELEAAGAPMPDNPIGIGWAGPTILAAGTEQQRERFLWPLLTGDEYWCQLFSEPAAGSDLAALTTTARRDGDHFVVNGQKIWNSYAEKSDFGILIARTDPTRPKHQGISYFICPMNLDGIEVRPIRQMTGHATFCEVFFTDVRIPADMLVGEENHGWALTKLTLGNERMSLSEGGVLWGMGPRTTDLVELARIHGPLTSDQRDRVAGAYVEAEVMRVVGLKILSELVSGRVPGPEVAVKKYLADRHGQTVMQLAKDLAGAGGLLSGTGPFGIESDEWSDGFLFSAALTIGGGTTQVLSNIIGERILGLPKDPPLTSP